MRVIWLGEGDAAWAEAENEEEQALIDRANEEGWTIWRLLAANEKPLGCPS